VAAYRIFRNNAPDTETEPFADMELAKASAGSYTARELVVIKDTSSCHFARFDRQLRLWVEGTDSA